LILVLCAIARISNIRSQISAFIFLKEGGVLESMTNYGTGGVLAAATSLPATSAIGLVLANHANPAIVAGIFAVSAISFVVVVGYLVRYAINSRK